MCKRSTLWQWGWVAGCLVSILAGSAVAQINGVLRASATNSRYFTDNSGRAVYLTGTHTWATLVDGWLTDSENDPTPTPFNFTGYLDYMEANNHNFIRLWTQHTPRTDFTPDINSMLGLNLPLGSKVFYATPSPWQRPGPGNAADGGLKFDLTKHNQAYFDRLRARVIAARDRGMYVSVMLFEGYGLRLKNGNLGWNYDPFHSNNNINSINGDPNGDGYGSESHTLQVAAICSIHTAYIRKVVDAVNDLDNVLYEISNEEGNRMGGTTARDWQYAMMNHIRAYEATKAKQHPVIITCIYNQSGSAGDNSWLTGSTANAIAPWGPSTLQDNPVVAPGGQVYFADTDHIWGVGGNAAWAWKMFMRGYNPLYMDGWGSPNYPHAQRSETNAAMGYTRIYADKIDLVNMTPQNSLASTGYCLAKTGGEYLAYQPGTGAFTVTLTAGSYTYEWFNPYTGMVASSGSITGTGAAQSVTPPFSGPAVLYCKVVAANQVATPVIAPDGGQFSDTAQVTITCATANTEIRYTTNNTEPTAASSLYSSALRLTASATLKAKGFKSGMTASNTATAEFTKVATGGGTLIDDNFDNGVLTTNPNGTGSGWNTATFNSGNSPTETGGAFEGSMGTVNGISAIIGKDNFTVWDTDGITASWVIKDITIQTSHAYGGYLAYCAEMGIVSANASKTGSEWIMSEINTKGGLYVSVGKKDNTNEVEMWVLISNKNVGTASTGWVRLPAPVGSKLGRRWTATFPLTVTVRMTSTGWSVNANQTGEGAIPIEGNWTTSLISGSVNASMTNEFANGAFLWTAGRNHGIVNPPPASYTPNSGRIERVTVTRSTSSPTAVSTPSISPNGDNFSDSVLVSLSCGTSGATVRYTTTGSDPTSTSTQYTVPFWVKSSTVIKARGFKSGLTDSPVASATFTKVVSTQTPFKGSPFNLPCMIQAEDYDEGGEGISYHDVTTANQGNKYRADGVDVESLATGGYTIGFVAVGEWMEYTVNVATAGTYDITSRVACAGNNGAFHIEFGGANKTGSIVAPNTGSWTAYQTVTVSGVALSAGQQVMRVVFDVVSTKDNGVVNFDYVNIATAGTNGITDRLRSGSGAQVWAGPNPVRGVMTLAIPAGQNIKFELYDRGGQVVYTAYPEGRGITMFDLSGSRIKPGVYVYALSVDGIKSTGRIVLLP